MQDKTKRGTVVTVQYKSPHGQQCTIVIQGKTCTNLRVVTFTMRYDIDNNIFPSTLKVNYLQSETAEIRACVEHLDEIPVAIASLSSSAQKMVERLKTLIDHNKEDKK